MWLQTYPALVREDPAQHTSTVAKRGAFSNNRRGHGVVSANTDAHQHSHAEEIPELVPCRALHVIRQADDEYDAYDHDDHLFPIDKLPAKGIAKKTERQLTDYIADVGSRIDSTTKEERVCGRFHGWFGQTAPVFIGPYRGDQIDDEEIVGVKEKTDTINVSGDLS